MSRQPLDPVQPGTFERLLQAYGALGPSDLAEKIRENISTVKNWRARGNVPLEYLARAARDTGRSLDWLVMGEKQAPFESAGRAHIGSASGVLKEGVAETQATYNIGELELAKLRNTTQALLRVLHQVQWEPPALWATLLQELMYLHGLSESGAKRVLETLKWQLEAKGRK